MVSPETVAHVEKHLAKVKMYLMFFLILLGTMYSARL
jgi:hypothetical protein